jgi:hypothetical protein
MVKEAQKVSGVRASFAVLTFPLLGIAVVIALYIWAITMAISTSSSVATAMVSQASTQAITSAVTSYAASHNGAGPSHAAMLVSGGYLAGANFVDYSQGFGSAAPIADESRVSVAGTTLDQFEMLPTNRRNIAAQEAADALPPNVIAHRLGDFVFTYHGIDLSAPPQALWLVVMWPDPDVVAQAPGQPVGVGLDNGTTTIMPPPFEPALAAQNMLRARRGLPPLPHPVTVKHAAPATGVVTPPSGDGD